MKRFLILLLAGLTCLTACQSKTPPKFSTNNTTVSVQGDTTNKVPTTTDFSPLFAPEEREGNVKVSELTPDGNYVTGNYTSVSGETVQKYPRLTNLPTLYLDFPAGKDLSGVRHGVYEPATYTFVDEYVEHSYYNLPLEIKGRGNYSWSFAQKPYSIKLGEKADFLGMGAAKKWTLITVSSDKTMMHNYLTQKMAAAMGLPFTCENEYVDVVVNGEYRGTWVLTERIQIHEERIDISEETGVLFEIEMVYRHSCDVCVVLYENRGNPSNSVHLTLNEYHGVELEDMTRDQKNAAKQELEAYFKPLNAAIFNTKSSIKELSKYIDVDSFINWYLLNEMTRNYDSQFVTSCYCFIGDDNRLYMSPVWDFDTCYGAQDSTIEGYRVRNAPWYTALLNNNAFFKLTQERWTEIRENGLIDAFYNSIRQTADRIAQSEVLNHTLYPHAELRDDTFEGSLEFFEYWLEGRIDWMDGEFLTKGSTLAPPPVTTVPTPGATRPRPKNG